MRMRLCAVPLYEFIRVTRFAATVTEWITLLVRRISTSKSRCGKTNLALVLWSGPVVCWGWYACGGGPVVTSTAHRNGRVCRVCSIRPPNDCGRRLAHEGGGCRLDCGRTDRIYNCSGRGSPRYSVDPIVTWLWQRKKEQEMKGIENTRSSSMAMVVPKPPEREQLV